MTHWHLGSSGKLYGLQSDFLDISPLQKFMGREGPPRNGYGKVTRQTVGRLTCFEPTRKSWHDHGGKRYVPVPGSRAAGVIPAGTYHIDVDELEGTFFLRMYGMDYDFDWVPPAPSPEKSPQEKALDDFIAKRKAKRVEPPGPSPQIIWRGEPQPTDCERALDRAMRRLSFHEQDIHTRLVPYRREE